LSIFENYAGGAISFSCGFSERYRARASRGVKQREPSFLGARCRFFFHPRLKLH
jgi:hypothetical protein